jgi:hypothetical protein
MRQLGKVLPRTRPTLLISAFAVAALAVPIYSAIHILKR